MCLMWASVRLICCAPVAVGGVLIAIIVFTPESITAVTAAMNNEMQRAINLCLGAFVSTVVLTVPEDHGHHRCGDRAVGF